MAGTRSALIVASSEYTDPGLARLRAPASDAEALAAVLRDPGIGGFDVRTMLNKPAHEVNLAVEEFFADREPDDLLLAHFSCHGVKDPSGDLYLAMGNTLLRRLGATAVAAEFVNRQMTRSRSRRVVLLLDCCYAGAFERGMTARTAGTDVEIEAQFGGRGRAVITASTAMEYALEGDQLTDAGEIAPSVFTSALVEGLQTGEADHDQDGLIALDEMYDYVYNKVRAATPHQTPCKWALGVQGGLVIARRARPVTTPAPLPRELQDALGSPFAAVRAAAAQELKRLLQGQHAGLALAARLRLEELTADDSRTVAAAATAALDAAPPPMPPGPEVPATAPPLETAPAPGPPAGSVAAPAPPPPAGSVAAPAPPPGPPATATPAPADAVPAVHRPGRLDPAEDAALRGEQPVPEPAALAAGTAPPAPPTARPGAPRLLIAGLLALIVPLAVPSFLILLNSTEVAPWWIVAAFSVAGIVATLPVMLENGVTSSTILWNLGWSTVYSLTVIGMAQATYQVESTVLMTEVIVWATGNVALCAWAAVAGSKDPPRADPVLAVLTGLDAVSLVLVAVALKTVNTTVWDIAAWVLIAAIPVVVLVSVRALRPAPAAT
jgi:Caspase domain